MTTNGEKPTCSLCDTLLFGDDDAEAFAESGYCAACKQKNEEKELDALDHPFGICDKCERTPASYEGEEGRNYCTACRDALLKLGAERHKLFHGV